MKKIIFILFYTFSATAAYSQRLFVDNFDGYSTGSIVNTAIQSTLNQVQGDYNMANTNWQYTSGAGSAAIAENESGSGKSLRLDKLDGADYRIMLNTDDNYLEPHASFIYRLKLAKGSRFRLDMQGFGAVDTSPVAFQVDLDGGLLKVVGGDTVAYSENTWITVRVLVEKNGLCGNGGCTTVFLNNRQVGEPVGFVSNFAGALANGFITKGFIYLYSGTVWLDGVDSSVADEPFSPPVSKQAILLAPNVLEFARFDGIRFLGIVSGTEIKILSSEGRVVFEDRAVSGAYTFKGRDASGRKLASGVYFAEFRLPDGRSQRSQFVVIR